MKHASFFSGVGGLDLGFERAGIETVSVSEIDPYANAVLAERFPGAPNLGSITEVNADDIPEADIWSGGFPCQDLSVAGKRAGFAGKRSSLAFTFLDLVEQRRPRWLVLENVPGLFSSNKGADFGRLLYEMDQLGYGVSWRTLDARYFGVAQRRRRVFLVASLESDRAGEVLLECKGCERHSSPCQPQRQGAASGASDGFRGDRDFRTAEQSSPTPDADGVRAVDGLAGRLDNQREVDTLGAQVHRTLQARDWKPGVNNQDISALARGDGFLVAYQTRADEKKGNFSLNQASVANSLSALWPGETSHRSMTLLAPAVLLDSVGGTEDEDDLLPVGLDSHRYRCCGNGVVAPVAEWIGRRIVEVDRRWREEGK